jgi:hypothetical protein
MVMNLHLSPYAKKTEPGIILGPKSKEVTGEWTKLNEQLQNVYFITNINAIESWRKGWHGMRQA